MALFWRRSFTVQHDHIDFRLKNVNEGEVKKVWRYQAWDSYSPNEQKWRTLVATLKKVAAMASNEKEVFVSAMHKLREFASLGYPVSVRKGACYRVARDGGGLAWLAAAKAQGALVGKIAPPIRTCTRTHAHAHAHRLREREGRDPESGWSRLQR